MSGFSGRNVTAQYMANCQINDSIDNVIKVWRMWGRGLHLVKNLKDFMVQRFQLLNKRKGEKNYRIENNLKFNYCWRIFHLCTKIYRILRLLLSFKMYSHQICFPSQEYNPRNVPVNGDTYVFQFLGQLCLSNFLPGFLGSLP